MAGRVTSARLIGRGAEFGALRSVLDRAAAGSARIALVSGEAGIGKTRLVSAALVEATSRGFVVAHGGCVDLGTVSVAFAPVAEALRRLQEQVADSPALAARVTQLQARLRGEAADAGGPVFEQVLALLTSGGPIALVLEDLHWADASTRDLVSFLARNLTGPVALVLTYRADEIVRGHPLRPVLANLERDAEVDRIALTGLGRTDLEALLDEICETPPDQDAIDLLHVRSGGNPFYIEELVAAGPAYADVLPGRIADLVLSRAATLPNESLDVLRTAAIIGDEVEDDLVAGVVGRPVAGPLREAVDLGLLVFEGTTCRFRHALVREALCREVLPGERTRVHLATADALERTSTVAEHTRWARIAHHRDEAQDTEHAFTASVRAAEEAERIHAFADAAEQYERALRLGPEKPPVELLLRACDAMQAGPRARRALDLAETALSDVGTESPEQRALVLERIGRINWKLHRGSAAVAAYEQGAALVADRPASRDKAFVLAALGQSLMLRQLYREAIGVLEQAISAGDVQGQALCSLGPCLVGMGQVDEAVAAMRRAIELSTAAGSSEDGSRAHANLMSCLYAGGRYAEAAAQAEESIAYVVRAGHARYYGDVVAGNAILALYSAGRWDEAERLHDDPRIPDGEAYQELRWLPVLFGRGRLDEGRALLAAMLDATADADDVQFRALALLLAAELASIDGRPDEARELVADAQVLIARTDDQLYAAKAHALAAAVATQRVLRASDRRDEAGLAAARADADSVRRAAAAFAEELSARGAVPLPEPAAWLVTVEAEHASASGAEDEAVRWADAVAAWDAAGQPFRVAVARYRQADAMLRAKAERSAAADLAREALAVATELGAAPLAEQVRSLAGRARLDLSLDFQPVESVEDRLGMTPRELEVLRLVARGRTNRQIGEALFISEKTASVHVTNVLRKLGVPNRVEAAAVAARAGLD